MLTSMNAILATTLFILDLLLANILNCFLIKSLLIFTLFFIAKDEYSSSQVLAYTLIALQTFFELNEAFFAPIALLLLIQVMPRVKEQFNIKPLATATMLALFEASKLLISSLYGAKTSILFTTSQFFANLVLLSAILILLEIKGRLGSRFYRW